jgi:hypothetical protein
LLNLQELKDWEPEIENKEIIVKELSAALEGEVEERLDCYA